MGATGKRVSEIERDMNTESMLEIHGVHCAGLSDFPVRGAARRHFFSASGAALSQEIPTVK
jgi:hypothetical protein